MIDENDAITATLLHGAGRTGGHTPWVLAVKAWHENIGSTGQPTDHFRPDLNDLTQPGPYRQVFIGFALHFTGMASDAFFGILKQIVFAHFPLSR
jgi:hypothetical protein